LTLLGLKVEGGNPAIFGSAATRRRHNQFTSQRVFAAMLHPIRFLVTRPNRTFFWQPLVVQSDYRIKSFSGKLWSCGAL
jgi:hypothetical protein